MKHLPKQYLLAFAQPEPIRVESVEALSLIVSQYGPLITPFMASQMAHVTHQRIYALLEQGRFKKVLVFGVVHMPARDFDAWAHSSRKGGRPSLQKKGCLSATISEPSLLQNSSLLLKECA